MPDESDQMKSEAIETLASRLTTMQSVGSSLAIMFIEKSLMNGGEIFFPTLGIKITLENLVGPIPNNSD